MRPDPRRCIMGGLLFETLMKRLEICPRPNTLLIDSEQLEAGDVLNQLSQNGGR